MRRRLIALIALLAHFYLTARHNDLFRLVRLVRLIRLIRLIRLWIMLNIGRIVSEEKSARAKALIAALAAQQNCHPEEPTCLRQVKSEMNAENRY
jgi:hypothetical protein